MTDALSNQDCSSLHSKMCVTDLSHWGILPLQFVDDDWLASIRERHWCSPTGNMPSMTLHLASAPTGQGETRDGSTRRSSPSCKESATRVPLTTSAGSNHLEERLLDQAQARASYTPPFLGSFA